MTRKLRNWCITQFDFEQWDECNPQRHPHFRYLVFQTEVCEKTGRPHQQAYVEFKEPLTFGSVRNLFGNKCHLEGRKGTRDEARAYCMKDDTRMPGTEPIEIGEWVVERDQPNRGKRNDLNEARTRLENHESWAAVLHDTEITDIVARHGKWCREVYENRPINVPPPEITLYDWQEEVMELLWGDPVPRRIIWIWSHASGTGKSTFADYVSTVHSVLPAGDYQNTLYAYDGQRVLWFDLTRHQTNDHIPYHALEKLSNQTFHLSTKYVSCRKYVKCHVVVTANVPPDEVKLPNRCDKFNVDPPVVINYGPGAM